MRIADSTAVVTGAGSGLGKATATRLAAAGARVVLVDLPGSDGEAVAAGLGPGALFAPADITDSEQVGAALDAAEAHGGPPRILVHCAGRGGGGATRIVGRDGGPADPEVFSAVVHTNLFGTFNVLRLTAARMAAAELLDGERGVCVLTASVAAYEGQIGQLPYAASKAGVVGMTIVAARDLASRAIRVCTIAPGIFDTAMLGRLPEEARAKLSGSVPHPRRLGDPGEYAALAEHIVANPMLNGETIRLDGAVRMAAK